MYRGDETKPFELGSRTPRRYERNGKPYVQLSLYANIGMKPGPYRVKAILDGHTYEDWLVLHDKRFYAIYTHCN